jgi:hypothetical protein
MDCCSGFAATLRIMLKTKEKHKYLLRFLYGKSIATQFSRLGRGVGGRVAALSDAWCGAVIVSC